MTRLSPEPNQPVLTPCAAQAPPGCTGSGRRLRAPTASSWSHARGPPRSLSGGRSTCMGACSRTRASASATCLCWTQARRRGRRRPSARATGACGAAGSPLTLLPRLVFLPQRRGRGQSSRSRGAPRPPGTPTRPASSTATRWSSSEARGARPLGTGASAVSQTRHRGARAEPSPPPPPRPRASARADQASRNDTHVLDIAAASWEERQPRGEVPCRREMHAAVALPGSEDVLVFGGRSADGEVLGDFFTLVRAVGRGGGGAPLGGVPSLMRRLRLYRWIRCAAAPILAHRLSLPTTTGHEGVRVAQVGAGGPPAVLPLRGPQPAGEPAARLWRL